MRSFAFLTALLLLTACSATPTARPGSAVPDPAHSSRNALDWAGSYAGTLPCADCPGIATHLTLHQDGSYRLATRYLDRQAEPTWTDGRFEWTYDGNHIQLDAAADHAFYQVREGDLLRRHADGTWPQGDQIARMRLHRQP